MKIRKPSLCRNNLSILNILNIKNSPKRIFVAKKLSLDNFRALKIMTNNFIGLKMPIGIFKNPIFLLYE